MAKQYGNVLADTCDPALQLARFNVDPGEVVYITVCGVAVGIMLPVTQYVAAAQCEVPYMVGGQQVTLSAATPQVAFSTPGVYTVDLSAVPAADCVKVVAREYRLSDLGSDPGCCEAVISLLTQILNREETSGGDVEYGCDRTNGREVKHTTVFNTDGTTTETFIYVDNGAIMTDSSTFETIKAARDVERNMLHVTNTGQGQAEYGRVHLVRQDDVYVDGVLDPAETKYWNLAVVPAIDVTADVAALVAAGSQIDVAPVRRTLPEGGALPSHTQTIVGAADQPLVDIPQFATYAEVYIEAGAGDSGLRWTKDGSTPTDGAANEQEKTGTTIRLLDRDQIDGFRASVIDLSTGDIDPAGQAIFKAVYSNVAPDED